MESVKEKFLAEEFLVESFETPVKVVRAVQICAQIFVTTLFKKRKLKHKRHDSRSDPRQFSRLCLLARRRCFDIHRQINLLLRRDCFSDRSAE